MKYYQVGSEHKNTSGLVSAMASHMVQTIQHGMVIHMYNYVDYTVNYELPDTLHFGHPPCVVASK